MVGARTAFPSATHLHARPVDQDLVAASVTGEAKVVADQQREAVLPAREEAVNHDACSELVVLDCASESGKVGKRASESAPSMAPHKTVESPGDAPDDIGIPISKLRRAFNTRSFLHAFTKGRGSMSGWKFLPYAAALKSEHLQCVLDSSVGIVRESRKKDTHLTPPNALLWSVPFDEGACNTTIYCVDEGAIFLRIKYAVTGSTWLIRSTGRSCGRFTLD
jgi:hypothetical protein